jgi:hypothetical protein
MDIIYHVSDFHWTFTVHMGRTNPQTEILCVLHERAYIYTLGQRMLGEEAHQPSGCLCLVGYVLSTYQWFIFNLLRRKVYMYSINNTLFT